MCLDSAHILFSQKNAKVWNLLAQQPELMISESTGTPTHSGCPGHYL